MNVPLNKKNVLFISWDSESTSYVENLFIPIFSAIQNKSNFRFHILQYSWASKEKINHRKQKAEENNISFYSINVKNTVASKIKCILTSKKELNQIIASHEINLIMPRSIWPASIVLFSRRRIPIIFDADGLAYLEKKEFGKNKIQNRIIRLIENKIIEQSEVVLTRSYFAIKWYLANYRLRQVPKFFKIKNGVNGDMFFFDTKLRKKKRHELNLGDDDVLFTYVGSIGEKYGLIEMFEIFESFKKHNPQSRLLILSSEYEKIMQYFRHVIPEQTMILHVKHGEVNSYLNAADIGFCLIRPTKSIRGVNPIKLNEYLMTGLPIIINRGIGDNEEYLLDKENCLLIDFYNYTNANYEYIKHLLNKDRRHIAAKAENVNSVSNAANSYICALSKLIS